MNEPPRNGNSADQLVDPQLTRLYHECAHEEPPAHLDAVILAAAREADAASRESAPEMDRTILSQAAIRASRFGQMLHRGAWRLPLSLAAVVVLSASVATLVYHPDVERTVESLPGTPSAAEERSVTPEPPSRPAPERSESALRDRRELAEPDAASRRKALERTDAVRQSAPVPVPYADQSAAPAAAEAPRDLSAPAVPRFAAPLAKERSAAMASPPTLAAQYAQEPPGKWGEKIVELRRQGRSAEADDLLAEFRQHFPDHVVPEEWMP